MGHLLLLLSILSPAAWGAAIGDLGEVLVLSGGGEACPAELLGEDSLVLRLDREPLPSALAPLARLDLSPRGPRPTTEALAAIEGARTLHLFGGSPLGWWRVFRQRGRKSPLLRALESARKRGSALVGWGSGGAYLGSTLLVSREELAAWNVPIPNPRKRGRAWRVIRGLGLVPGGLIVLGSGARSIDPLVRGECSTALVLEGEVAWRFDPAEKSARVEGPGRVLLIERRGARVIRDTLLGAHLSVLGAGALWKLEGDRIELGGGQGGSTQEHPVFIGEEHALPALELGLTCVRCPLTLRGIQRH